MIRSVILIVLGGAVGAAGTIGYIMWIFYRNNP